MITKMSKVQLVVRHDDQQQLLDGLHQIGMVHLIAVDPQQAVAEEAVATRLDHVRRAVQILSNVEPAGAQPNYSAAEAVDEILAIQRRQAEQDSRLSSLYRQIEHQSVWGDVTLEDLETLKQAGVEPRFCLLPAALAGQVQGEFVAVLQTLSGGKVLLAVVSTDGEPTLPEEAEPVRVPQEDNPTLRAEAAEIDAERKAGLARLAELAQLMPEIENYQFELSEQAEFSVARHGGYADEDQALYAVQGWVPQDKADQLIRDLNRKGIEFGIQSLEPDEEDLPPTEIKYAKWAMPIKGLFDIIATYPGYREFDLSSFFMVALPLFAAMLIGDAGYGLVFMVPPILLYNKMVAKAGKEKTDLLMVMGAVTLFWGVITANYFGVSPELIAKAGGFVTETGQANYDALRQASGGWATIGKAMIALAPLWRADSDAARQLLIQISFLFGGIHLVLAHVRQAMGFWPNQRAWSEIGWCLVLAAMLGVIWLLFFGAEALPVPPSVVVGGIVVGLVLVILFTAPSPNPVKRIGVGIASSLLPLIGTFSDTMSYIRLMAVGLASFYIAVAFNSLGATLAGSATWFAGGIVVAFGHLLNIGLAMIAIFAHGVRLNMLEFSNNAGVQWSGYAYSPFAKSDRKMA